ncbi:MAG: cobalamin-dependent protein [Clostridia bacterium]|nr:cobalamin-dependent protein [Clostridia bacterium]
MSGGLYNLHRERIDTTLDLKAVKPYGDTMNDGKVQVSFTLPVANSDAAAEAARRLALKMGLAEPNVAIAKPLDENFTFFVVYGSCIHTVNYEDIHVENDQGSSMDMEEINAFILSRFGRKIRVIGAATGTDAHTVGIDAIMNRKGFAGHYGLERYEMIETINLGAQVDNEELVRRAIEFHADAILVSQTVTQKDIHIMNLTELIEILEAEGVRDQMIVCCGGSRITNELAKELGFDAGFGAGKFAEDDATFIVTEMEKRGMK